MTHSFAHLISGLGLLVSAFIAPAYSATLAQGGVIHFRGAIVADPCEVTQRQRQLAVSCPEKSYANAYGELRRRAERQGDGFRPGDSEYDVPES